MHEPRGDMSMVTHLTRCCAPGIKTWTEGLLFPKVGLDYFGRYHYVTQRYHIDELISEFGGHNVIKTVCIEAQLSDPRTKDPALKQLLETKLQYKAFEKSGLCNAFVCHVDLCLGKDKVAAALKTHMEANPNVRGVRHQIAFHESKTIFSARDSSQGILLNKDFRDGFLAVVEAGLTFDAFVYHTQLPELAAFAADFSSSKIVLDHIGTPLGVGIYKGKKEAVFKEWEEGIRKVAENPNVHVKLSGAGMPGCGFNFDKARTRLPPTSVELADAFKPYFAVVIDAFGVDRCMFASNFPVDKVSSSYVVLVNAVKRILHQLELTNEQQDAILHDNSIAFYNITA